MNVGLINRGIKARQTLCLFVSLLISITMIATNFTLPSSAIEKPFEQFVHPDPPQGNVGGYTGAYFDDTNLHSNMLSRLNGVYREVRGDWNSKHIASYGCIDISDKRCSEADELTYTASLELCPSLESTNCVVSISARIGNGDWVLGKLSGYAATTNSTNFRGDSSKKVPSGGSPSLWTFEGISHQAGREFLLKADLQRNINVEGLEPSRFVAGIYAISRRPGEYTLPTVRINPLDAGGKPWAAWSVDAGTSEKVCSTPISTTECALAWPHPSGIKYRIVIRINSNLKGFLHGRLGNPAIEVRRDGDSRTFTIQGEPLSIPILSLWRKNTELRSELNTLLDLKFKDRIHGSVYFPGDNTRAGAAVTLPYADYNTEAFNEFLLWLKESDDKSTGTKSVWMVRTLSASESYGSGTEQCLDKYQDFTGIVTTNSGMYVSAPPSFNKELQTLDYKVSSPHRNENGELNLGVYNLVLRSDVARCIYGFGSAPIAGSVSVVSADGVSQIATSSVVEKDGWLYMSAGGFTFSAPTVRVKLQEQSSTAVPANATSATPTPSPSASPTPVAVSSAAPSSITTSVAVVKKKAIICVKGSSTKKITGQNPKCPQGWKKKV